MTSDAANRLLYTFEGELFPDYLKRGNACQFITPTALHFCKGTGVDVGAGAWPLPGAIPVDVSNEYSAMSLPAGPFDFVFSSHCLEHLFDPVAALEHWRERLKPSGVLFLYLPHPAMLYWRPEHCRKHRHLFHPEDVTRTVSRLGFESVIHSERDLAWSFAVVGFKPAEARS